MCFFCWLFGRNIPCLPGFGIAPVRGLTPTHPNLDRGYTLAKIFDLNPGRGMTALIIFDPDTGRGLTPTKKSHPHPDRGKTQ